MYEYIIRKLKRSLNLDDHSNDDPSNSQVPVLFLVLKGRKPSYRNKIDTKELIEILCENLPVVDARIYQKFSDFLTKIDTFI